MIRDRNQAQQILSHWTGILMQYVLDMWVIRNWRLSVQYRPSLLNAQELWGHKSYDWLYTVHWWKLGG